MLAFGDFAFQNAALYVQISFNNKEQFSPERTGIRQLRMIFLMFVAVVLGDNVVSKSVRKHISGWSGIRMNPQLLGLTMLVGIVRDYFLT
jgi:hypothetical protein